MTGWNMLSGKSSSDQVVLLFKKEAKTIGVFSQPLLPEQMSSKLRLLNIINEKPDLQNLPNNANSKSLL